MKDLSVVILAAGAGTRMKSEEPKVLQKVCGQSLVKRVSLAASSLEPKEIVYVVGYKKELLEGEIEALRSLGEFKNINLKSAIQEKQLGTGDALKSALKEVEAQHVLVISGDTPLINSETLLDFYKKSENSSLNIITTRLENPYGYGRVIKDNLGEVEKIVEEKDCNKEEQAINEVNVSIYLAKKTIFEEAIKDLNPNNSQSEYYLTDVVAISRGKNKKVFAIEAKDSSRVMGANSRYELAQIEEQRRHEIAIELMQKGVIFEDYRQVYIDEDAKVAGSVKIGAGTRIYGNSIISDGVIIDGNSIISNSFLGKNSHIKLSCLIADSKIKDNVSVGPFAQLRPGTCLEDGVKIGNFVEVKNAIMQKGAKANHLSYVGDANVGQNVNLGAGTITCNYDGISKKSKTLIGDNASIGSNTSLVAPVEIGAGAFVAAGSVITKNVSPDSLALSRAEQKEVKDWAKQKRKKASKGD